MYDSFSEDYDRFVNWNSRLVGEMPFIEAQIKAIKTVGMRPAVVLDSACGTGMHAIALARSGYAAAGADFSPGMIARARQNAAAAGVKVRFETAGFGALTQHFGRHNYDAVLCLGNSLPHLLDEADLAAAYQDFAECLRRGGRLLIQNRNFDAVLHQQERWIEPQSHREGDREWLFLRFYDFEADGLITFNIVTLRRINDAGWSQQVSQTRLRPLRQAEVTSGLAAAGFTRINCYGNMAGEPFEPHASGNLIVVAEIDQ
jgi:SAM-dependent methyltransferase